MALPPWPPFPWSVYLYQGNVHAGAVGLWLTCEGFEGCQVVAIQHVHMAREGQVLAEAATAP